jgi:hypothetical protein
MPRKKSGLRIRGYTIPGTKIAPGPDEKPDAGCGVIEVKQDGDMTWEIQVNEDEGVLKLWITDTVGNTLDLPLADLIEKIAPGFYEHQRKVLESWKDCIGSVSSSP